jgi:hypothetical protein
MGLLSCALIVLPTRTHGCSDLLLRDRESHRPVRHEWSPAAEHSESKA